MVVVNMNIEHIFDIYYNGEKNIITPKVYGYDLKKITYDYYVLFEKSEGELFGKPLYGCSTLLYNETRKTMMKIDLSKAFGTKEELDKYISAVDFEMVYGADLNLPVKSLTYQENLEVLKLEE